jgi:nucleoside-diphosphate-sugar epimerase
LRNDSFNLTSYNIGSEERITIKDLAFLVQELSNKGLDVKILNQNKSAYKRSTYVPNCKKIKEKFNLVEKVSLSNSIIKMLDKKIS